MSPLGIGSTLRRVELVFDTPRGGFVTSIDGISFLSSLSIPAGGSATNTRADSVVVVGVLQSVPPTSANSLSSSSVGLFSTVFSVVVSILQVKSHRTSK